MWKVVEFLHVKPGKGSAFVRSKMKNLETGSTLEKTWKAGESFGDAQVDKEDMQFSYQDGDDMVFMNMETFEEVRECDRGCLWTAARLPARCTPGGRALSHWVDRALLYFTPLLVSPTPGPSPPFRSASHGPTSPRPSSSRRRR